MLTWVEAIVVRLRWLGVILVNCQSYRLELRGTGEEFLQARLGSCLETTAVNPLEKKLDTAACGEHWLGMTLEFHDQALLVRGFEFLTEATPCTCVRTLRTQVRSQPILRSNKKCRRRAHPRQPR